MAAGLRIFWLPLVLGERIELLVLAGRRVLLLQNSGLDGGSANESNFVISRAAITTRRGTEKKPSLRKCVVFSAWGIERFKW